MYIICLFITTLIAYEANILLKGSNKKRQSKGKFCIFLIAFIFSLIAGLRDFSVGTDIGFYASPTFNMAQRYDFVTYFTYLSNKIEPLYLVMNYVIVVLFNNIGVLLFLLQFIPASLILARLCDYKGTDAIWLGVLIYNCFFFPISLNLMRQTVAMAIVFYATRYIFGSDAPRNIKKYIVLTLISMGFHATGGIGLFILLIYFFYKNDTKGKSDKYLLLKTLVLLISLVLVVVFFDKFVVFVSSFSGFTSKYTGYTNQNYSGFQLNPFLSRLPFVVLPLFCWKKYRNKFNESFLIFIFIITDIVFAQLRAYSPSLYRVSIYFSYFRMIEVPCLISCFKSKNKMAFEVLLVMLCVCLWIYQIVYCGNEEVYPYVFRK